MKTQLRHIFGSVALLFLAVGVASAAGTVSAVSLGSQEPATILAGQTATYRLVVTRAGSGSLDVYLAISGLPTGCTATITPSVLSFREGGPSSKTALLTIGVPADLAAGSYSFQVTARHGSSSQFITTPGMLVVGKGQIVLVAPVITSFSAAPETGMTIAGVGAPGRLYKLLASQTLENPVWTEIGSQVADAAGVFTIVDADMANFSSRFYKFATE